jgi:hypothetical protein
MLNEDKFWKRRVVSALFSLVLTAWTTSLFAQEKQSSSSDPRLESSAEPAPAGRSIKPNPATSDAEREDRSVDEPENAPGADSTFSNLFDLGLPIPDYVYEPSYYQSYGLGARPIADYAPAGYEGRDYQDSPGFPEFRRITPPPPPTAEDKGRVVTRGMFPGSFLVPGVNTSFRLRGFVRLAGLNDFQPMGVPDAFVTNSIPVPATVGQNFNFSARMSRFALESWTPTNFRDWTIHTFIEGDFFNGPGQAAGGGGNPVL